MHLPYYIMKVDIDESTNQCQFPTAYQREFANKFKEYPIISSEILYVSYVYDEPKGTLLEIKKIYNTSDIIEKISTLDKFEKIIVKSSKTKRMFAFHKVSIPGITFSAIIDDQYYHIILKEETI